MSFGTLDKIYLWIGKLTSFILLSAVGVGLNTSSLLSQPRNAWVRYYSTESGFLMFYDVYRDDRGLGITGVAGIDAWTSGIALWRTDLDGVLQWARILTREQQRTGYGFSIVGTDDGGFLIGGRHSLLGEVGRERYTVIKVDDEGNLQWWREFHTDRDASWGCVSVLELKSDSYFTAGMVWHQDRRVAYCNKLNQDGDLVWEFFYPQAYIFSDAREVEDGILLVGYSTNFVPSYLVRISEEGRLLSHARFDSLIFFAMASCPVDGGHVILSTGGGNINLLRLNSRQQVMWRGTYRYNNVIGNVVELDIRQMPDGGFTVCLTLSSDSYTPALLRVDNAGNEMWRRNDRHRLGMPHLDNYTGITLSPEGFPLVVGYANRPFNGGLVGVLIKVLPERSSPTIREFYPHNRDLTVLRGDSIHFWIRAEDWQEDSLSYRWYRGEELVGTDTAATIDFPELGDVLVKIIVSDTTGSDSARWMVHVKNLFISAHQPDSLNLIVRRNARVNFSLEVAYNGDPQNLNYRWWLRDREDPHRREEVGGNSPQIALNFPMSGQFGLEGYVSDGEASDSVRWEVRVRGLIRAVYPEGEEVFIAPHQEVRLGVIPFDPGDPTLRYWWGIDADTLASESQITEQVLAFPEVGQYSVWCFVRSISDSLGEVVESDSQFWRVTVSEPEGIDGGGGFDGGQLLPQALTLTVHPNPFNASAQVRVYLPEASKVRLGLYDLAGREVALLSDGTRLFTPGLHTFTLSADGSLSLPAGLYLLTLETPSSSLLQKVVIMR